MKPKNYTLTKFGTEAQNAIMIGVREVTEATATTLGPLGKNVLVDKGYQVDVVHDGVTVASNINPEEEFANRGAQVVQEAAKKQRDDVGDGTTVTLILTQAILDEALKMTSSGINPMLLRKGLESGRDKLVKEIEKLSTPVKTLDQKIQIATISAEDPELGKLIAETIHKIGDDGVITIDESKASETFVEAQEGMQVDKGLVHQFLMTDPEHQRAVLEDVHILVTDIPLNEVAPIAKFLDSTVFPNTKKVLFISPEIGADFLAVLIGAKMQGQFIGLGMRAPGIGTQLTDTLLDICALTGATLITKEGNQKFDDYTFEALGHAHRVIQNKISTIIEGGNGHRRDVLKRIQVIREQQKDTSLSAWEQEQLKGRLAKLTSGVAVIKVGGQTEIEMKERKERADDSVKATQAAVKHGLVPGGETVYLNVLNVLDHTVLGEKILKDALKAPFKRLVENAGYDSGQLLERLDDESTPLIVGSKAIKGNRTHNLGIDVLSGEIKDMIKEGIIDPASVPTEAIKNAVSVSIQLATLGAATVQKNEYNKKGD